MFVPFRPQRGTESTKCSISTCSLTSLQHPPVQPDDDADESEDAEPWGKEEIVGHEAYRCVVRSAHDEAGGEDAPKTLTNDQSRRHERTETLCTIRVGRSLRTFPIPMRDHRADDDRESR